MHSNAQIEVICVFTIVNFQVEGKGNGIKTVIVNMADIAKALSRPPTCKLCLLCNLLYPFFLTFSICLNIRNYYSFDKCWLP